MWRATLEELRAELTPENYARWFATTRAVGAEGIMLRVAVADAFHQQWLDRQLRGAIERALQPIQKVFVMVK